MDAKFAEVAAIAAIQNGRITTKQLAACRVGRSGIEKGVDAGRLHRVHRGVFAVGHLAPSRLGDWHGAVLAGGPEAVLSIRSCATLMQIRDGVGPRIDVTLPGTSGRRRPGIDFHHADLLDVEKDVWSNIPVTSPARTMVDLAHHLKDREAIEWAMREMQFRRLYDRELLELSNHRRPNRVIGELLDAMAPTGSPLEVAFLHRVVRRHSLPVPESQAKLHGFRVDFLFKAERMIVEVDGKNHDLPMMRIADAHRDSIHRAHGFEVLRYRWADIHRHDERTAGEIRQHLRVRHLLHA